ncbi:hybrid sensor histidine kinase/response regulator [Sphingomonas sp.]|uniref:hybrid sensor histidine kinase/response regulator n=1 Tax=Sphingomonas sp. TaxID=28214 RepID=UPI002C3A9BBB|nr:PAS domain-containing protein [Sphingomonas sp.]HTG37968.1 PAS domain-containing protein [Sphingomonas sp.]
MPLPQFEPDLLETFSQRTTSLFSDLDSEGVIQQVCDAARALTDAAYAAYFHNLYDESGERLGLFTLSGARREDFERLGHPRATPVFAPTFANEIVRSDDIMVDPRYGRFDPHNGMPPRHLPVRSYLAVPVVGRSGDVLGGLLLGHPEPCRFDARAERLVIGLAAQAAVAIDNARLFEAQQREIAVRAAAEAALAESESRLEAINNSIDQMIWTTLPDGHHDYYNARWYEFTGVADGSTDGEGWNAIFHPDDQPRAWELWRQSLDTGEPYEIEYRLRHRSGEYRWVLGRAKCVRDESGRITRWFGTCTDIHDLKTTRDELRALTATLEDRVEERTQKLMLAEEALRQAQKMEAVGQLTGGIAHDFNNLLTIVTGNIGIAQRALTAANVGDIRAQRALDGAMKGAERAATLTQRLLAFSRRQPLAPKPIDVDRLIASMADLLARALGETIRTETVSAPGLWRVEADPHQLESAILNLAVNSRDAMPDGGRLTIETANAVLDERYSAQHAEVAPGPYVMIAVTDTGIGMTREQAERAFEPFFTTKEVGKGTGLGLSMVYGFVKQSGGHVKIYSEAEQGTTIRIYLPRLVAAVENDAEPAIVQGLEVSRRRETVLVCEDDDDVRAYTVECLRELGYRVLEAHDGPSALRLLSRQDQPVDLLFTDVVMPGMSGRELADAARAEQPSLRVLYTSGYTRNTIMHGGRLDPGVEMVAKPFSFETLARAARDVLDRGRSARVLVCEQDAGIRALATEALAASGVAVDAAATAAEALGRMRAARGDYRFAVVDAALGGEMIAELRALSSDLPLLIAGEGHPVDSDSRAVLIARPYTAAALQDAYRQLVGAD